MSADSSDLEVEMSTVPDTVKNSPALEKSVANDSLRSMYSTNRSAVDPRVDLDDIIVIDTIGNRPEELPLPQSTPVKQVVSNSPY